MRVLRAYKTDRSEQIYVCTKHLLKRLEIMMPPEGRGFESHRLRHKKHRSSVRITVFFAQYQQSGVIRKIRVYDIYKWLIKVANYFHAILVRCEENSKYQYKLVIYDNTFDDNPLEKVYAIGNIDSEIQIRKYRL